MKKRYRVNARRLDLVMDEKGVSANRLAKAAGHSDHSYIARMRRGEDRARSATKETAEAIATALGERLDYLFVEVDSKTGHPVPTPGSSKSVGLPGRAA